MFCTAHWGVDGKNVSVLVFMSCVLPLCLLVQGSIRGIKPPHTVHLVFEGPR